MSGSPSLLAKLSKLSSGVSVVHSVALESQSVAPFGAGFSWSSSGFPSVGEGTGLLGMSIYGLSL